MKSKFRLSIAVVGMMLLLAGMAVAANCTASGSMIQVKKFRIGSFEYVDFIIRRPPRSGFSWAVTSPAGPTFTHDPSGNTVTVTGPKYKQIVFRDVVWMCTIPYVSLPTTRIKAVKNIGQFEGIVTYVVGYVGPTSKYQGTTASNISATQRRIRMKFIH